MENRAKYPVKDAAMLLQSIKVASDHSIVFTHGDLYHSHLLWDDTARTLGVLDFSGMVRGDPAVDFAESFAYGE